MSYNPGLHIIAEFSVKDPALLSASSPFKQLLDELVGRHGLVKIGEVYHDFPGGGYTAVVCLTESHISVHTWPEFGVVTFDVFLSNFRNNNEDKVEAIYQEVVDFYHPETINKTAIKR